MMSPALEDATTDKRLKGADVRLLLHLHHRLSYLEFRAIKLWPVASALHMSKGTVSKSIRVLIDCGYLKEGVRQEHGGRTYALQPSLGEPAKKSA